MRVYVLVLGAVLAGAAPAAGAGERGPRLAPPVRGEVVRAFAYAGDPFARGHHRGLDLAAEPGMPVRAACSGRVTFAGSAGADGRAVTIRCGAWSVTHLPLRGLAVHAGERVVTGAPLGTVAAAPGHAGLHLGVRRATDRFGYVDPAPLLDEAPTSPPAAGPPPRPASRPHGPPPPHPAPPQSLPGSSPVANRPSTQLAPWPAWAGLALLLLGVVGAGTVGVTRSRRTPRTRALAREVP